MATVTLHPSTAVQDGTSGRFRTKTWLALMGFMWQVSCSYLMYRMVSLLGVKLWIFMDHRPFKSIYQVTTGR